MPRNNESPGYILVGMEAPFTRGVLESLLSRPGPAPTRVLLAGRISSTRLAGLDVEVAGSVAGLCRQRRLESRTVTSAAGLGAWLRDGSEPVLVACLPWRIESELVGASPNRFFNLHPSALPRYRGPDPLFWQFREGEREFGITLHAMARELDAGPIVAQRRLPVAPGATRRRVEQALASAGAGLFHDAVRRDRFDAVAQESSAASAFAAPVAADYRLETHWSRERAYRFIAGTREDGLPFRVVGPGIDRFVSDAADPRREFDVPDDGWMEIDFADGSLRMLPAPGAQGCSGSPPSRASQRR